MVVGDVTTAVSTLIVGAGPGGYAAAIRAAQLGQSVTMVVDGPLGGTCLNSGCIPLKALVSASRRFRQLTDESLPTIGIQIGKPSFDWGQLQSWKTGVVERLSGGVGKLLAGHKIEIVHGLGWFLNERELRVEGEYGSHRLAFEKCLLATGASPLELPELPFGENVFSPQQALAMPELPASVTVIGDDYIALEFATLYGNFGIPTTLLTRGDKLLPEVDQAAVRLVQAGLRKLGVQVVTRAQDLKMEGGELVCQAGGKEKRLAGPVVVSAGVRPTTDKLNLKEAGVRTGTNGELTVNAAQVTNQKDILAVGDVTGQSTLATAAFKQAKVAAETMVGRKVAYAPQAFPKVVHTTPELAYTGLTAEAANLAGFEVVTGRFPLAANGRGLTLGSESGLALVVAEKGSGLLLGMTIVGPQAGDLIMEVSLGIEMGATLTDIAEILHPHPGLAELTLESVESALEMSIHTL